MRFITEYNTNTETDEEVVEILSKHFHKVYYIKAKKDWIVLNNLVQKPIYSDMNIPLSIHEFEHAIKKLILHRAPGFNDVSPNAIKALNKENILFILTICYDYFENDQVIEKW